MISSLKVLLGKMLELADEVNNLYYVEKEKKCEREDAGSHV